MNPFNQIPSESEFRDAMTVQPEELGCFDPKAELEELWERTLEREANDLDLDGLD